MGRKVVQKTSFLGGEAGPLLEGRSDLAQFQLGNRRQQNFITLKGGAATRRPGTRFVTNTLSNKPGRLIPFIFSYDSGADSYAIEITQASSTTLEFRCIRVSDGAITIPTNHTLTVDATLTNIHEIQYTQSADFLFITHASFEPQILVRTSTSPAFTLSPYIQYSSVSRDEYSSLAYLDENITTTTLAVSSASVGTGVTLTFSAAYLTGTSADVGRYFLQLDTTTYGLCVITAASSTTVATCTVIRAFGGTSGKATWWESAWSPYQGWPRTLCFYNQRLVFGGTSRKPDTFWMSKVDNYLKMSPTLGAAADISDPLNFQLASSGLNQIRWMVGGKKHTIGTTKSEWVGTVTNNGTNLFVQYDEETSHGSAPIQPSRSAYTIPFVQRSRQAIREMVFDFYSDSYTATDLTLFGSQVGMSSAPFNESNNFDVYIRQVAYTESPVSIMWVIDSVGRLYGLTRDKQQQIASWHSHKIGGIIADSVMTGGSGDDYPSAVTSICTLNDGIGRNDRLWMIVRRSINGTEKYFVEYMDDFKPNPTLWIGSNINASGAAGAEIRSFLDCADIAVSTAKVLWTGYGRFASTNAYVVAMNSLNAIVYCGLIAVDGSGHLTLPRVATVVVVGLHADAILGIMPIEGGDAPVINLRSIARIDTVAMKLFETWGLRIGKDRKMLVTGYTDNTSFEVIPFDLATTHPDNVTFTGVKEVPSPSDAEPNTSLALVMQEPYPCTVLSISTRVVNNEV